MDSEPKDPIEIGKSYAGRQKTEKQRSYDVLQNSNSKLMPYCLKIDSEGI